LARRIQGTQVWGGWIKGWERRMGMGWERRGERAGGGGERREEKERRQSGGAGGEAGSRGATLGGQKK